MFRCQLTGQLSNPAVGEYQEVTNEVTEETSTQWVLITPAEKPVKLAVRTRKVNYSNTYLDEDERIQTLHTEGFEITKEITIRACNVELAKKKYGLE